jgi:sulfoxide reductase heme-binding subunit YedZ
MTLWVVARGAGLAALLLLTVSTCIGALMTGRGAAATRVVVQYLHRVTASLGLGVLVLHIATILADSYANVGWRAAIVPFTAAYRPTWVGLGTIAVYTFVLVAAVGLARGRFAASQQGAAVWRGLHGLAYVGWGLAMLHGLKSGTDSGVGWVRWLYVACATSVAASVAARAGLATRPDLVRAPLIKEVAGR